MLYKRYNRYPGGRMVLSDVEHIWNSLALSYIANRKYEFTIPAYNSTTLNVCDIYVINTEVAFAQAPQEFRVSSAMTVREVKDSCPDTDTVITTGGGRCTKTHFMDIYDLLELLLNIIRISLYINEDCLASNNNLTHCTTEEIVKESRWHLHRYFLGDYLDHCPDHIISSWVFIWQYIIFHAVDCFVPIRFRTDPQRNHYVWRHMKSLCLFEFNGSC